MYINSFKDYPDIKPIPVSLETGEVPVYNEFLCSNREDLIEEMDRCNIGLRPFVPNLARARYLKGIDASFPNSSQYGTNGLTLPSGPGQSVESVELVIDKIKMFFGRTSTMQ